MLRAQNIVECHTVIESAIFQSALGRIASAVAVLQHLILSARPSDLI